MANIPVVIIGIDVDQTEQKPPVVAEELPL